MLTNYIEEAFTKKRVVSTLFLDIKGAFDRVSRDKLIEIVLELGLL